MAQVLSFLPRRGLHPPIDRRHQVRLSTLIDDIQILILWRPAAFVFIARLTHRLAMLVRRRLLAAR